jgi:hypothetical protein
MLFSSCNFFSRFNEHLLPEATTIDKISAGYATLLLAPQEQGSEGGNKHILVIEKNVCCTICCTVFHITEACRPTCAKTEIRVKQVRSNS